MSLTVFGTCDEASNSWDSDPSQGSHQLCASHNHICSVSPISGPSSHLQVAQVQLCPCWVAQPGWPAPKLEEVVQMDMNVLILCANFVSSTRPPNFYSHLGVLPWPCMCLSTSCRMKDHRDKDQPSQCSHQAPGASGDLATNCRLSE